VPAPEALHDLIGRYARAVTARDPAAVAGLFTEDAVQHDPANTPPNVGRAAIEAFFQSAVDASTATDFEVLALHTCGDHAAIDFKITVTLDSGTMVISGIEVFTVTEELQIASVSAYWDDADVSFDA
jgi:steroid Delta-isomerase